MNTVPIVVAGHVDHGKSTLVARILLDSGHFADGKYEELLAAARRRGIAVELSFLLDAFQLERDQAVTIDATRVWFASPRRRYEIIDAPGHVAFVRHMVSGAADAAAAVLLVDAAEGVSEQTRRHALLLALLGLPTCAVAVNKMDAVAFSEAAFRATASAVVAMLSAAGLACAGIVPTVARDGDNLVRGSARLPWYGGPTLVELLDALEAPEARERPTRFLVHDVYRRGDERVLVGSVASGRIAEGMTLAFSPSRETATVTGVVRFPEARHAAVAGEEIGITIDRPLFIEPGDVASELIGPPTLARHVEADLFWLDAEPAHAQDAFVLRCGTRDGAVTLTAIRSVVDVATFATDTADRLARNDVADVVLHAVRPLVVDLEGSALARFALYRGGRIVGGGRLRAATNAPAERPRSANVFASERRARTREPGFVVWLTGLPCSGKSTLAERLAATLAEDGVDAYVLDGDRLRTGLNGDLGFSLADRSENVRRTGEVAALFADAGLVAIVALVSPMRDDRARARAAAPGHFYEIAVQATLATCERRDVKGLYRRARAGELRDFTGIDSPYEAPAAPDLVVDTDVHDLEAGAAVLTDFVRALLLRRS